ncbi:winged helix DNA-binding domain-containing protein [Lentzea tibetensis]|uniref:Winged helix DNA-binding domain-containing protein n=1 Tax=Lentzea tibetensis TaxID=2591470 RepID=A0A563EPG5_9PSEU|nr:winged helix DNA-binding domain-containing protein [Lentzea tibetensis]TWP49246.1 winged helix DNA-binding domain-containing protein [Lentzea tibetensis]
MPDLTRHQVLAHRIHAHELDRRVTSAAELRVFDLGVQDNTAGSAALSLSARLDDPDASGFTVTWTVRGAPHLHRPAELPALAKALWPWSDADALARMSRPKVDTAVDALRQTAKAMRAIVTKPMTKGEISTALTPKAPEQTVEWCRGCDTHHVSDPIFRLAALPAGLRIVTGEKTITFERIPKWPGVPAKTGDFGDLVEKYLRLHGPAGPSEVASYFGTTAKEVKTNWPALREVTVEGRKAWLPEDVEISDEKPNFVRLLPPTDPYLQARDRDLLLPDKGQQKDVFRVLGRRGGVLVDGEIVGSWQARTSGKRLDVTVTPYRKLNLKKLEPEAERAAQAKGLGDARVH